MLNQYLKTTQLKLSESQLGFRMSCQDILAMRKLITQKYDEYEPHLNPFSKMLFCENWEWPSFYISQNPQTKSKNIPSKTSLKNDISSWFLSLNGTQKYASTAIKGSRFVFAFLQTYRNWNSQMLYHIYQHRQIPDYISKNNQHKGFEKLVKHLRIAWLDEPVLYFEVQSDESPALFIEFINWMDETSSNKLFEYAHKIKNKDDPQENLLWFTQQSFQPLQSWLVNQFQKVIIKSYFDRDKLESDIYSKIEKLKLGISKKTNNGNKKDLEKLFSMNVEQAISCSHDQYVGYQSRLKIYEDEYYEQAALLLDYEGSEANKKSDEKKKKKKNKKKKYKTTKALVNNKLTIKKIQQVADQSALDEQQQAEIINQDVEDAIRSVIQPLGSIQATQDNNIDKQMQQSTDNHQKQWVHDGQQKKEQTQFQVVNDRIEYDVQNLDKISNFSEFESSKSIFSSEQPNLEKSQKNKSGKSHPEFYCHENQSFSAEGSRSLSQQFNNNQIGCRCLAKVAKKKQHKIILHKKQKSNKNLKKQYSQIKKTKNSSNISVTENKYIKNNCSSYVEQSIIGSSQRHGTDFGNSSDIKIEPAVDIEHDNRQGQLQNPDNTENEANNQQRCNRKRRKKNKTTNLIKQLNKKISSTLIARQLNNFVDALSTETNNLYEHKRVTFQRVRFFIQSIFPTTQAMLFGSNAVGLSLPTSDIDIMLFNLPTTSREQASEILAHLAIQINTMNWIVSCSAYLNAKVPLVKLQIDPSINYLMTKRKCDYMINPMMDPRILEHLQLKSTKKQTHGYKANTHNKQHKNLYYQNNYNRNYQQYHSAQYIHENGIQHEHHLHTHPHNNKIIKVDLSVNLNDQGNLGAQSTDLMKKWMAEYPQIHRAALAFKYILAHRGYSSNFRGGIGSYCLFILIAAYLKERPQVQQLDDGELFMEILKFYGQQFQNQIKSIKLHSFNPKNHQSDENQLKQEQKQTKKSCFISLEESYKILEESQPFIQQYTSNSIWQSQQNSWIIQQQQMSHNLKDNPLRIFDPINNRIMSGNCQLFPQIKAEFRRIHKQLADAQLQVQKQIQATICSVTEVSKMLQNKKNLQKWLNKYEVRSGFDIKKILEGTY